MKRHRKLLRYFLVTCMSLMLGVQPLAALEAEPAPALPERGKVSKNPANIQNLSAPIADVISGPAWLMAHGVDNRAWMDRPGWNTLTRQDVAGTVTALNADNPAQLQGAGLGVLVPYRDPAPAFSRDLLITRDFSNSPLQTEPDIAVNPNDPDHIVLGTIDYNFPNNTAYVSIDGGATWDGPRQVRYLRRDRVSGGDPVVEFDSQGNVLMGSISIGIKEYTVGNAVGFALVSSISVAKSVDGGYEWQEPVSAARSSVDVELEEDLTGRLRGKISLGFLDKPWMTVGPHPTIEDTEVIYVTYVEFNTSYEVFYIGEVATLGSPQVDTTPYVVSSTDGGHTWSEPVAAGPTVRRSYGEISETEGQANAIGTKRVVQGPVPAVDSQGNVFVTWLDSTDDESQKGLGEFYIAKSKDGGESFEDPKRIASFLEPGFRPRNAYFRYWASVFPKMVIGPADEIYIVYVAIPPDNETDEGDVFFIRSMDGGNRWSQPKQLNHDRGTALQFFPAVDVGPDGTIHVMWGDMRDDPVETRYHIYYTRSADQGETWGFELPELNLRVGDTRVTDFPSNPNRGFPNGLFIGDYFSIAAVEDEAYMVWADTRLGEYGGFNQKIGFTRQRSIPAPEIFVSPNAGSAGERITVQGHGFQPLINYFLLIGGTEVSSGRTDELGRMTANVFVPISGEGGHAVTLVDGSGNFASTSFYMEFGFDNIETVLDQLRALLQPQ